MKSGENGLIGPGSNNYGRDEKPPNAIVQDKAIAKPQKPSKPKPQFYSVVFAQMQQIAKDHGYNLVLHGSMNRDLDLIAIPWVNEPKSHQELIYALCDYLGAQKWENESFPYGHGHSVLPGGRDAYVIDLNRNGKYNGYVDAEYYIDISITPLLQQKII